MTERSAIINGLREFWDFQKCVPGVAASEVMSLVLMTHILIHLREMGFDW